jgi:succinate-acetate transporter protein
MTAASAAVAKVSLAAVLATTAVRLSLTGIFELSSGAGWEVAAGIAGLLLCAAALYAALAFELEAVRQHEVLPTMRPSAADAPEDELSRHLRWVVREAGVRDQL